MIKKKSKRRKKCSFVLLILSKGNPCLAISLGGYKNQMRLFMQKFAINYEVLYFDYQFQNGILILESINNIIKDLKFKKSYTNKFKISTGILILLNRKPPQCNIQKIVFKFNSFVSEKNRSLVQGKLLGCLDLECS